MRRTSPGRVVVGVLALAVLATAVLLRPSIRAAPPLPSGIPGPGTALGYVSSSACLPCHPGEHASFRRTYHRTMTQVATPETTLAPLDGRVLERRGSEVWATLSEPVSVARRVLLTTGSHREQAFWVAGALPGELRLVPFVWLVRDQAFVARRDAFLLPPDAALPPARWNSSCIACHAVAGEPRHDPVADAFDTRAAELGIACEACHGPGAAHVDRHRDPVARYMQHASKAPDPTIVHPARLSPERSAALCGQCHAYAFPRDESGWWSDGYSRTFRAGDSLDASRTLITRAAMTDDRLMPAAPVVDAPADSIFWPDGSVRVGGREYNGLVASPCYLRGAGARKMTCLSCHAMHEGAPAGQIAPQHTGDRACTGCHSAPSSQNHSHHAAGSVGSACVACHMPKTSYALLSAVRSHRIDSPNAATTIATGRPNACNLCHLDRTLAWTAERLSEWYGTPLPVPAARADLAAGVRDGLAGNAAVRALVADALGSAEAASACRPGFSRSLLVEMRSDPYPAVRFIAERSLRAARVREDGKEGKEGTAPALDLGMVHGLLAERDTRAITIAE